MLDHSKASLLCELETAGAKIKADGREILCAKCGIPKPQESFNKDKTRTTGRHPYCKECRRKVTATYRARKGLGFQKEYIGRYYRSHADKVKERTRKWVEDNRQRKRDSDAQYKRRNKDKLKRYYAVRKSRLSESGCVAKEADARVKEILDAEIARCLWCGCDTTKGQREVDHIVPLSRGGRHRIENLCCSCKPCNHSKGAKLPEEFIVYRKMRGLPVSC